MASLYEQLMASKGAPKAAAASNSMQLRKAPMSLRSAMRKYAEGGDVTNAAPDYSRANDAFGGAGGVNDLRNQFLSMGLDENAIGSIFSQYYKPESQPQTMTPPEPIRPPERPDPRPPEPRYEEPPRPIAPDRETPYRPERPVMPEIYPQQPQTPQTSYRQNADGTLTEIGYDGQPISGYTEQQTAMDRATRGLDPSEYRYVWNGEGYDKLPNGPQIGYNPEPRYPEENVPPPPREDPREEPRFYEPEIPQYPEDPGFYQPPVDYTPMPDMPVPRYYEPEVPQYPEDPGFYQPPVYDSPTRPIDYYNPSPPMDFTEDPGFYQPPVSSSPKSKQGGDLAKLIADMLARKGGGGSLEEQRKLMALLETLKGE